MLKKLQTKFILILMSFVSVILLSVFGIVCCSNYVHDKKDVEQSLEMALRLKDKDFSISFGNSRNFNGNSFVIYTDSDYEYMITSRTVWNIYAEDAQSLIESVEHKEDVGALKKLGFAYKKEKLTHNAPSLVDLPTIRDRAIIRLEPNEVADLLDVVQNGDGLTDKQKAYHKKTQARDLAILTLFLGTGIRISELVGIDMDDINFTSNEFSIVRKGGKQDILVFGDEAREALLQYMLERERIQAAPGHEDALFLSLQKTRLTVRAVENLVEKYAKIAVPLKKISPHKLRSTYGTNLYRETGDIYLVADVLGHKDVNTTRKHYAAVSEDRRRLAAKVIKLRDD